MPLIGTATGSFFAGRRASAFSRDWHPSNNITAAVWFDASDTSSYSLSGSNVTAVTDKGSVNATITVNGTPDTNTSLDGKNTFTFSQSGSNEDFTTNPVSQSSSGNHWAIGVFQWNAINNNKDSFFCIETSGSPKRDYAVSSSSTNSFDGELDLDGLVVNRMSSTIGNAENFTTGVAQNTWAIVGVFFNKTGNQIGARIDGANAFNPVNDYDNNITGPTQDLRIMRNRSSERMGGKMAEFFTVAGIPGVGSTDISTFEKAEGYLAHKWALTSNLPVSHPYKNTAPTG